ncbi:CDP-glycerol glycerophosphotransferase family protein [Halalkalicoccus subterraneus]|uniref:CDP-glycerol glycerophosphotransferase family protein n=1 Tax=Halalkalicoccus subterraneus TaxID=2675002 RepID=UPI000EFC9538|nr:CDP-glycerol glycerophosphotransferase family protein [Halalkalicoccus subterraneus]
MALLREACSLLAHRLARFVPREDSLWVFGSRGGERFEGNAKYLFLNVAREGDARPVWISKREETVAELRANGFDAHRADSLRGRMAMLRAGVVFVTGTMTDMPLWPTGGAYLIQLWHGVPLKRIATDAPSFAAFPLLERLRLRYTYHQFDALTLTAAGFADSFRSAFRIDPDFPVTGYPRNDALAREVPGERIRQDDDLLDAIADIDADRLVAYLPTYREGECAPAEHVDFERLDAFLADHDAAMLVKFHPFNEPDVDGERFDSLRFLPAEFDVYPTFREVDALVTDYSSVYFDYLLLDRPVAFYAYDREEYAERPGFNLDYDEVTPGPVAETFEELLDALEELFESPEAHTEERERVRRLAFDHADDRAAERVRTFARVLSGR